VAYFGRVHRRWPGHSGMLAASVFKSGVAGSSSVSRNPERQVAGVLWGAHGLTVGGVGCRHVWSVREGRQ
jgi:hypothetical protein